MTAPPFVKHWCVRSPTPWRLRAQPWHSSCVTFIFAVQFSMSDFWPINLGRFRRILLSGCARKKNTRKICDFVKLIVFVPISMNLLTKSDRSETSTTVAMSDFQEPPDFHGLERIRSKIAFPAGILTPAFFIALVSQIEIQQKAFQR